MKLIESKYAAAYKKELEGIFSKSEADAFWTTAELTFQKLISENPNQSDAVRKHTYVSIFPAISIYKAVKEKYPKQAMEILENGAASISKRTGEQYMKLLKIPGFKGIFMRIFSKGVKSGFGLEAGFSHEFISDSSKRLEFNVTKCPYQEYCAKYECSEIGHVFCRNDEYAYGNLPGIQFIRTKTLADGDCCDFKLIR